MLVHWFTTQGNVEGKVQHIKCIWLRKWLTLGKMPQIHKTPWNRPNSLSLLNWMPPLSYLGLSCESQISSTNNKWAMLRRSFSGTDLFSIMSENLIIFHHPLHLFDWKVFSKYWTSMNTLPLGCETDLQCCKLLNPHVGSALVPLSHTMCSYSGGGVHYVPLPRKPGL